MIGELTQKHLNKLEYYNNLKTPLTPQQKYRKEEQEHNKILEKREIVAEQARERTSKQERTIFINHLYKHIPLSEITATMIEKEEEFNY
jgi:hypothetical protein